MKFRIITIVYIGFSLLSCKKEKTQQEINVLAPLTVATYNIRVDLAADIENPWNNRVYLITDMIKRYSFDVIGTQEVSDKQLSDLTKSLPNYYNLGAGRDDGHKGEHTAIFFKKDKFVLLNSGDFWLSETPDRPGNGWDAQFPRICTWALLEDRSTGGKFYFFNTHLDNAGVKAKNEGVTLVMNRITKIVGDYPFVLTGDFNANQTSEPYLTLSNSGYLYDAFSMATSPIDPKGTTFNDFDPSNSYANRIDHIFLSSYFKVDKYEILVDNYSGKLPSDHYPVHAFISSK